MSLSALLLVLATPAAPLEELALESPASLVEEERLEWFAGSWDDLLERARAQDRLVFVEFWASWCTRCRKLEETTLRDARVIAELGDLLSYSLDAEGDRGRPIAERFHVEDYPTLVFLEPDGEVRDVLSDYLAPDAFLAELSRIKRNEGTISRLRQRIASEPGDLEARYRLAVKLEKIGDEKGHDEQIRAILASDPEGKLVVTRRIRLSRLLEDVRQDLKLDALYGFLAHEDEPELLFPAWQAVWSYERFHLDRARSPEEAEPHRLKWLAASRALWRYAPDELRARIGNNVAWYIFEYRRWVEPEDLRFALAVAERAVKLAPKDPAVVDTLACCQFALGQLDEALATIRHCIELDPANPQWRRRLDEFTAGSVREQ